LRAPGARAAATEAELLQVGTQMPDSPQLPSLIIELQDIANASGVKVTSIAPGQPVLAAGGQYTEVALSTQVTAEWDDLLDYLKRLDHSTRLLRVSNLTVHGDGYRGIHRALGEHDHEGIRDRQQRCRELRPHADRRDAVRLSRPSSTTRQQEGRTSVR
jgi:hypothetical protein